MATAISAGIKYLGMETSNAVADIIRKTGKTVVAAIKDVLGHHPKAAQRTITCCSKGGIALEILAEEQATDSFGRQQKVTVVVSPYGLMDGFVAGPYKGRHAAEARETCWKVITAKAHQVYHEMMPSTTATPARATAPAVETARPRSPEPTVQNDETESFGKAAPSCFLS